MTPDPVKLRRHTQRVLLHLSRAEGIRESGADPSDDMAEARRLLIEVANEFGCFLDPIDKDAMEKVEGRLLD